MKFIWRRCLAVAVIGLIGAAAASILVPRTSTATLCLLAAGTAIGELLVLRSDDSVGQPLSYALFLVFASSFDWWASLLALCAAQAIAILLRATTRIVARHQTLHHGCIGLTALIVYRSSYALIGGRERLSLLLGVLLLTVAAMIVMDQFLRRRFGYVSGLEDRGRRAWSALASSGMLMAIGERGVAGIGHLGVWGPILFAIPLLAAWYSFERLESAKRAYQQTIEALAMAPEFAGLVPVGHAERVASLCRSTSQVLGLDQVQRDRLEIAARLHHLGAVTLDDPALGAPKVPAATIAHVTGDMLRGIESLSSAGDIVARAGSRRSFTFLDARGNRSALVLQYANAFDDLVVERRTDPHAALAALRADAAGCDESESSVIDALEIALFGDGVDDIDTMLPRTR